MSTTATTDNLYQKYKHIIPSLAYMIFYLTWWVYLENKVTGDYHIIHTGLDDRIPFCEFFIIPYFLWFAYVVFAVLFLFFTDKTEYYRSILFLFTGMTIFLIVSTLWPNGHDLRPPVFPRENLFTACIKNLWLVDTPTNLVPSIHVFNALGAHFAIAKSKVLEKKKWASPISFIICVSIILSTVFIKQHSVFDVATALLMAGILYPLIYKFDPVLYLKEKSWRFKRQAEY